MKFVLVSALLLAAYAHGEDAFTVVIPSSSPSSPILTALSQTQNMEALKISIKDIPALTFKAGKLATRVRTTPVPQLNCITGCFGELPTSAQCENKGWDGVGVSWSCRANLQKGRKLENTRVRCEAFTKDDPVNILAGSCVLDYGLGGQASGGGGSGGGHKSFTPAYVPSDGRHSPKSLMSFIVPIIIIIILVVIICAIAKSCRRSSESSGVVMGAPPGQPGGYYGGGGGAYPAQPGFNPGYGQPGYVAPMAAPVAAPSGGGGNALGAGLGGFAAGAATGGLLGYMMGNHGNGGHSYHGGSYGDHGGGYGGYGGGGGGGGDYGGGDMGGGGGYEMSTDFADTAME